MVLEMSKGPTGGEIFRAFGKNSVLVAGRLYMHRVCRDDWPTDDWHMMKDTVQCTVWDNLYQGWEKPLSSFCRKWFFEKPPKKPPNNHPKTTKTTGKTTMKNHNEKPPRLNTTSKDLSRRNRTKFIVAVTTNNPVLITLAKTCHVGKVPSSSHKILSYYSTGSLQVVEL